MEIKIRAHTCYIGKTGFAAHARGFFRNLSYHTDLRVRNYTWDDKPESHLVDRDYQILETISLNTSGIHELEEGGGGSFEDFPMQHVEAWSHLSFKDFRGESEFVPDIDIVLMDTNHYYYYEKPDPRVKIRIAYLVWETTRLEDNFYRAIQNNFTHIFVPTKWHREMLLEQGYPLHRIFVVPEGIDEEFHNSTVTEILPDYSDNRFKFLFFGRWDYRKAVPEILKSFLEEFKPEEEVDFILSADNLFSIDGMNSTEERLEFHGLQDDRIKIKHFPSRSDYANFVKTGHVLVTCARSEGWNIPLAEAIAAGTPVIYSNYGAQLEFAEGIGTPVQYTEMRKAELGTGKSWFQGYLPGDYCEPDYDDLKRALRETYENWNEKKAEAMEQVLRIREEFSWSRVAKTGFEYLKLLMNQEDATGKSGTKDLVVILSHPDNEEREAYLKICNHEIKRQGYKTLVMSHIPTNVDSNYTLVVKENPVFTLEEWGNRKPFPRLLLKGEAFELTHTQRNDYGYAVYDLLKRALRFAFVEGFERIYFVNYDYLLFDEKTLKTLEEQVEESSDFFVGTHWKDNLINTGLFSVDVQKFMNLLFKINTPEEYVNYSPESSSIENVITKLVNSSPYTRSILQTSEVQGHSKFDLLSSFEVTSLSGSIVLPCINQSGDLFLYLSGKPGSESSFRILQGDKYLDLDFSTQKFVKLEREASIPEEIRVEDLKTKNRLIVSLDNPGRLKTSEEFESESLIEDSEIISFHFVKGPWLELTTRVKKGKYRVEFIDKKENKAVYTHNIENNCWVGCSREYYVDWLVKVTDLSKDKVIFEHHFDLNEKRVFISLESESLGDTIAWFAPIEEFQKKHNCKLIVSTFKNDLFRSEYPNIQFIERGVGVPNIYAGYKIGWFYERDSDNYNTSMHPCHFRDIPMQQAASDILGLDLKTYKPRLVKPQTGRPIEGKYICIGIHATAQAKYWNHPHGWQTVVDYLKSEGYEVVLISKETGTYMGNTAPEGIIDRSGNFPLSDRINYLAHADAFIGVGSGLSWLAWASGTKVVMISGFSKPHTEFEDENLLRIWNPNVCNGCFNRFRLDAGDWNWCPDQKGTTRQFECSKSIQPEDVIYQLKNFL
jgi:autotransporter strand-loop-strand O-heptosyltransferase